jgi:uncharacterized protein (TIGR04222 family)
VVLAAAGDTWGISGSSFIVMYLVIAAAVWVATTRARRALADPRPRRAAADLTGRPHDVAYLNGGGELAVTSALSAMHLRGTIAPQRGSVQAVGRLDPDTDDLERAIHFTAGSAVARRRLPFHKPVTTALETIQTRLVDAGLLVSPEQRSRILRQGLWMLGVAGLGLVRLLAGTADGKPAGFLLVALIAVVVVALVQLGRCPRRTRLGDRALRDLAERHHSLSPTLRPDWAVYGPAAAALGVGIFGVGALWASDPAFADELAVQKATTVGSAAGTDGGGCGSSSDSGGGSSCGGGGGCGGGGCGG